MKLPAVTTYAHVTGSDHRATVRDAISRLVTTVYDWRDPNGRRCTRCATCRAAPTECAHVRAVRLHDFGRTI